ncbi:hypothetical protein CAPTEDRAFT_202023 [Capitella teleta]|uniref:Uncharacterized protein n=1 Tax=Capitella teleta TaxID=283909 RepID=R7TB14_CAPTE|nr:hypothetical protein CAPTEDRAFT_202023 [Capitella teleta]|eukprot:ELT88682.1 hypothetical protein CAPTEDRAFT_202023 [Capitella teleta]
MPLELIFLAVTLSIVTSQPPISSSYLFDTKGSPWAFQSGSKLGNQPSHLQARASDVDSTPGSREGSAGWSNSAGHFYLFGGKGYDAESTETPRYLNDLWVHNATTQKWVMLKENGVSQDKNSSVKRMQPKPRKGAMICGIEGVLLLLFGGQSADGYLLSDTWIYTIPTDSWLPLYIHHKISKDQAIHPSARTAAFSWCLRDRMVIHGGVVSPSGLGNDVWEFSFQNLAWKELVASSPPLSHCCGSSWSDYHENLFIFGGSRDAATAVKEYGDYSPSHLHHETWMLSLSNSSWSQLKTDFSPPARQFCSHWRDTKGNLWLTHGLSSGKNKILNDTWKFVPATHTWFEMSINSSNAPSARFHSVAWFAKDTAHIFGGFGYNGRGQMSLLNDLWSYRLPSLLAFSKGESFIEHFTPGLVFLITMASTASVVCVFGLVFCMKKTFEYPFRASSTAYNVRYTPLKEETSFEFS